MHKQLEQQFNELENNRKKLFSDLKKYSDDVLNKKPNEKAWSVAEVIGHLMMAEEMSLKYLQKKTLDVANAKPEGLKNKWRWLLVQIVFKFNIKFKAPEIVEPKMSFTALSDLETRWAKTRSETFQLLNKLNDEDLNKELWKHAVAGKMNLHHMVTFFGVHFNRHLKQIDRTLVAVAV